MHVYIYLSHFFLYFTHAFPRTHIKIIINYGLKKYRNTRIVKNNIFDKYIYIYFIQKKQKHIFIHQHKNNHEIMIKNNTYIIKNNYEI